MRDLPATPSDSPDRLIVCRAMDQNEQQDTDYEAPKVEDLNVKESPATTAAGAAVSPPA